MAGTSPAMTIESLRDGGRLCFRKAFQPSCPALCRASTSLQPCSKEDVDGRDKPGHDEKDQCGSTLFL